MKHKLKQMIKPWMPPIILKQYNCLRQKRSAVPMRHFDLPTFAIDDLFPGIWPIQLHIDGKKILEKKDIMALPIAELFIIAAICKFVEPKRIFEFGTYIGLSTLVMAMNTGEKTRIFSLDIDPTHRDHHVHGTGVGGFVPFEVGSCYRGTSYESKITQLLGNSMSFDYSGYKGSNDLVFIDADHSYNFAREDTKNAFNLVSPDGIIIWDDYIWNDEFPECAGVARCLHELHYTKKIYHIAGTRLAAYLNKTSTD